MRRTAAPAAQLARGLGLVLALAAGASAPPPARAQAAAQPPVRIRIPDTTRAEAAARAPVLIRIPAPAPAADAAGAVVPADSLPPPPPSPEQVRQGGRELEELRSQIRRERQQLEELSTLRLDEEAELQAVGREAALVRKLLAGLDARERVLAAEIDSLQVRLAEHEAEHGRHRERLAARLRGIYRRGPRRDLQLALTAGSFSSLVSRLRFATMVARLDEGLVASTREAGLRVLAEKQRLQSALTGIWEAREEARLERQRLAELEALHRGTLEATDLRRERARARLESLQNRERDLQQMLASLEQRRAGGAPEAGPGFDGQLGRLSWPLDGQVVQAYGRSVHPEFKTVTVSNGIAIAAPLGSPVQAVAAGTVAFADRLPGFGQCVIVEHGAGYYSLYANLSRVFVARGGRVARGEVLAEVGLAEEGGPRLYFELRLGKTPLDPAAWLEPRPSAR